MSASITCFIYELVLLTKLASALFTPKDTYFSPRHIVQSRFFYIYNFMVYSRLMDSVSTNIANCIAIRMPDLDSLVFSINSLS